MIHPTPFSTPIGASVAAALDWWRQAGVDCDFADVPRQWLADRPTPDAERQRPATPLPAAFTEAIAAAAAAPDTAPSDEPMRIGGEASAYPQDLAAFDTWWLAEPSLDNGHVEGRVAARGGVDADLMILIPQPEASDAGADKLLSGAQGALLSAMLTAMGVREGAVRLAAALPRHMPQPQWAQLDRQGLGSVLRHHVNLARPRRIIAFGGNILPLLGHALPQSPAVLTHINQNSTGSAGNTDSAQVSIMAPVMAPVMAMPDLGMLLERPRAKAVFWHHWLSWQTT